MNSATKRAIWIMGIPGAGKSTLARQLCQHIGDAEWIDSDLVRAWLTPNPTWSESERQIVYRAIVELVRRLTDRGIFVVVSATSGGVNLVELLKPIRNRTHLVFLATSLRCAFYARPNNLYERSRLESWRLHGIRNVGGVQDCDDVEFARANGLALLDLFVPNDVDSIILPGERVAEKVSIELLNDII